MTRAIAVAFSLALAQGCLFLTDAAYAQATISDCEKIQAADAYNQCLAKFGPPAKTNNLEPERPGDIKSSSAEAAATGGKPSRGRHAARRHRGHAHGHAVRHSGRKRMSISVGK
jgi:hypothetical protein